MARENHTTNLATNAPDYLAWHVTQRGEKSYWNKVGAAWVHKDGKGYTLKWSQKTGHWAKVYPKPLKGYENGEAPEFYRSV